MTDLMDRLQASLGDRYTFQRRIGHGGMATVYLAQDHKYGRPVAFKVLHPELAATLGPDRFRREIGFAARLQHPHILTVLDSGKTGEGATHEPPLLWFTMPFVEGESLRDRLVREKQLPVDVALRIARETALALDFAHRHGVVHRDVKPENILLCDGQALVADFGIARALGAEGETRLTETGIVVGTPAYMSPEQAAGEQSLDGRVDVYALGCVLYEMLAGEPPYTGPTAQAVMAKRLSGAIPSVRRLRPSVPPLVEQAIGRALAPVPADRFGSAAEFAAALEAGAREPGTGTVPPPGDAARAGRRAATIRRPALLLLSGGLLALGLLFIWRQGRVRDPPADATGPTRLAVLPFENLGAPEDEYFADGVSDAIRGKLTMVPGVQVIARTSSLQYRRTSKTPREVGQELGVEYLLTGTVRWEKRPGGSSRVQVNPELIQVSTAAAKWQQPFDAVLSDVFRVQGDVAARVANALGLAMGAGQRKTLEEKPTADLAAYDAFLKGEEVSQSLGVFDPLPLSRAVGFYEQAVALDPGFLEAWAQLSRAHSQIYYSLIPSPERAEQARVAAERALALAPARFEAHLALADYHRSVRGDFARALGDYRSSLRLAASAAVLRGMASAEQSLGRWDSALEHARQAQALDPRAAFPTRQSAITLVWLRRYSEAQAVLDRGLALDSTHLSLVLWKTMALVGQGDLAGARAFLRAVPKEVDPTALVAYLGRYWDLFWVLDEEHQSLLLRLTPGPFNGDRAAWGLALAATHHLGRNTVAARAYADSARLAFEAQVEASPDNAQLHSLLGMALAYLGRSAEAIREGERAVVLTPISRDAHAGPYFQHQLVRIYLLVGEHEKALDRLEPLLEIPYYLSPAWLRIDPTFDPIREHPRFKRLVAVGG